MVEVREKDQYASSLLDGRDGSPVEIASIATSFDEQPVPNLALHLFSRFDEIVFSPVHFPFTRGSTRI